MSGVSSSATATADVTTVATPARSNVLVFMLHLLWGARPSPASGMPVDVRWRRPSMRTCCVPVRMTCIARADLHGATAAHELRAPRGVRGHGRCVVAVSYTHLRAHE